MSGAFALLERARALKRRVLPLGTLRALMGAAGFVVLTGSLVQRYTFTGLVLALAAAALLLHGIDRVDRSVTA